MLWKNTFDFKVLFFYRPAHAIGFAAMSSITGLSVLYFGVNPLTAALGAGNLILYSFIYTPLKRISITNTWLGSIGKYYFQYLFIRFIYFSLL